MVHRPIDVRVVRDGVMVRLIIDGSGTLNMPKEGAHAIARELMRVVGEIEVLEQKNGRPFPL